MTATFDSARATVLGEARPWKLAVLWLAVLTPFFFLSYGFANWMASRRSAVPSLVFGWEHQIPFLAWTIVPYWSTDLLYALSLFSCRSGKELNTLGKRLAAAQLISISGFLLFPLQFSFERPHPAGLFGWMFDVLASFDKPFNQAPSLHASLTVILLARYSRQLRGWTLLLMRGWMVLVGASTLTTFQHHFIDIPTGVWVGLFCIAMFPEQVARARFGTVRDPERFEFGAVYLSGGAILVGAALRIGGAAWWLLWPAGSLLIVAAIYCSGRPELFRKENGVLAPAMTYLLAPYLAAAWLNSRLWNGQETGANEIADGIWLGRLPGKAERNRQSIASMVDLTAELPADTAGIVYRCVPMLDLVAPTERQLSAGAEAIEELKAHRPTLVCCALGYSRSAAAMTAWLIASGKTATVSESIALIGARRPRIILGSAQRERLEEWRRARTSR